MVQFGEPSDGYFSLWSVSRVDYVSRGVGRVFVGEAGCVCALKVLICEFYLLETPNAVNQMPF